MRGENGAVGFEDVAVNEISDDVADGDAAVKVVGIDVVTDETETAGTGEVAGLLGMIGTGLRDGDREDAGHVAVIGNAASGFDGIHAGVAPERRERKDALLEVIDVMCDEAVAEFIEDEAKAAAALVGGSEIPADGIETKIRVAEFQGELRFARSGDAATVAAV